MHRSWGNAIDANEAFDRMGADVMRWLFCDDAAGAEPEVRLRPGGRGQAAAAHALELRLVLRHLREHRGLPADVRRPRRRAAGGRSRSTAGSSRGRGSSSPRRRRAYDRYWTPAVTRAFEQFVDDLSNWYIRRSRRRFYSFDEAAFRTLWYALVQGLRVIAPVMPFLADELWRNLVAGACEGAPDSVHLAGWPEPGEVDTALLAEIDEVREVVELGRQARAEAERQAAPAAAAGRRSTGRRRRGTISTRSRRSSASRRSSSWTSAPRPRSATSRTCRVLGPRLGPRLPEVRARAGGRRLRGARRRSPAGCGAGARRRTSCSSSVRQERGWAHSDALLRRARPRARRRARAARAGRTT